MTSISVRLLVGAHDVDIDAAPQPLLLPDPDVDAHAVAKRLPRPAAPQLRTLPPLSSISASVSGTASAAALPGPVFRPRRRPSSPGPPPFRPAPISNFPALLAHIDAAFPARVFLEAPHWVRSFGTIYGMERTFSPGVSALPQFHMIDGGMETCALTLALNSSSLSASSGQPEVYALDTFIVCVLLHPRRRRQEGEPNTGDPILPLARARAAYSRDRLRLAG
ncbi:hypothetical protein FB451DRAFT_1407425 [Mycena latifolia]|nr:hypothetical protein FB451DRAFT_1407425 [Mycena latifolia]